MFKNNKHDNPYLQNAYNKYGKNNFKFEIIEECIVDNLISREQYYLDKMKPWKREIGYNICITATGSKANLGKKFTKEHKEKISKALKGRKCSEEHIKKMKKSLSKIFSGEGNPASKLNKEQILTIKELYLDKKYNQKQLAILYNVTQGTISHILTKRTWKSL